MGEKEGDFACEVFCEIARTWLGQKLVSARMKSQKTTELHAEFPASQLAHCPRGMKRIELDIALVKCTGNPIRERESYGEFYYDILGAIELKRNMRQGGIIPDLGRLVKLIDEGGADFGILAVAEWTGRRSRSTIQLEKELRKIRNKEVEFLCEMNSYAKHDYKIDTWEGKVLDKNQFLDALNWRNK